MQPPFKANASDADKVEQICQWLSARADQPFDWALLVDYSGMNTRELQQIFIKYKKVSILQWLRAQPTGARSSQQEVNPPIPDGAAQPETFASKIPPWLLKNNASRSDSV